MRDNSVSYINAWGTRAQQVPLVAGKKEKGVIDWLG